MLKGRYILCIDDDEDDCQLLSEAIIHINNKLRIEVINSGDKALEFLHTAVKNDDLPRLITLDLNMPGLSGIQTLPYIKAIPDLVQIPVIILSTNVDGQAIETIEKTGVSVLKKPSSAREYNEIANTINYMML